MSGLKIGMLVTHRESIAQDLWLIEDVDGRIATLKPISFGATQMQSPIRDILRYRIKTTDQVFFNEDQVEVKKINNPREDDYFEYVVDHHGEEKTVPEHQLKPQVGSAVPDPCSQLLNLDAVPAHLASARVEFLHSFFEATAKSLGIVGYNGARMFPIPHQVGAARYCLLHGRTRFILADEVGLGKTIEAGLIVSTLRKYFPEWKTAFFVPESITIQWAFEMYGKFGKSIFRLSDDDEPEEGEPDPGVILPHGHAPEIARKQTYEILVIDEAHQILRDPAMFDAFLRLSKRAHAVLLLTATPTSDDGKNICKLLNLADPEFYDMYGSDGYVLELFRQQDRVEKLLELLQNVESKADEILSAWENFEVEDDDMAARILSLKVDPTDMAVRSKISAMIVDRFYPRARILRYQRKSLLVDNELPERVEEPLEFEPSKEEKQVRTLVSEWLEMLNKSGKADQPGFMKAASVLIQAASSSPLAVDAWLNARRGKFVPREGVSADPVRLNENIIESIDMPEDETTLLDQLDMASSSWQRRSKGKDMKGRALARLKRYETMLDNLKPFMDDDEPHRIIIFTSFECNVKPLYLLLNKALGKDVEVFMLHAEIPWREREKAAFGFQECPGSAVMISDELGGEGRNFQFADAVFHFDLPLAAWMVEQRIGRLDRVGRDSMLDVDSQILVSKDGFDEATYEFMRDALGVFNESLAPVEDMAEDVARRMLHTMITMGTEGVKKLIDEVVDDVEKHREREMQGLLERGETGFEEVRKLNMKLDDSGALKKLEEKTLAYTKLLGSMIDRTRNMITITVGSHHPLHAYMGILDEMQGYFNRVDAVKQERLEFFSTGHPFVRKLAQSAVQESSDRLSFSARSDVEKDAIVFHARVYLPQDFMDAVRELPEDIQPALLCSAAQNFGTVFRRFIITLDGETIDPGSDEAKPYIRGNEKSDTSLHSGEKIYDYLPEDWESRFCQRTDAAREWAQNFARERLDTAMPVISGVMSEVLTRHFGADFAIEAQMDALLFSLDPLSIEFDAVEVFFAPKAEE